MATELNGVDVDVLQETIQSVKNDPKLGLCHFRAENRWIRGAHNESRISEFYAAGETMRHQRTFVLPADEPPLLAGDDTAPGPVEYLLIALASCVTTSMVAHATVRGIEIEEIETRLEGDLDLSGFFGLADVPTGYQNIRVTFSVKSDASADTLRELAGFSPVLGSLLDGVPVDLEFETRPLARGKLGTEAHPI